MKCGLSPDKEAESSATVAIWAYFYIEKYMNVS